MAVSKKHIIKKNDIFENRVKKLTLGEAEMLLNEFQFLNQNLEQKKQGEIGDAIHAYDSRDETMALKTARGIICSQDVVSSRIETLEVYIHEQKAKRRKRK